MRGVGFFRLREHLRGVFYRERLAADVAHPSIRQIFRGRPAQSREIRPPFLGIRIPKAPLEVARVVEKGVSLPDGKPVPRQLPLDVCGLDVGSGGDVREIHADGARVEALDRQLVDGGSVLAGDVMVQGVHVASGVIRERELHGREGELSEEFLGGLLVRHHRLDRHLGVKRALEAAGRDSLREVDQFHESVSFLSP